MAQHSPDRAQCFGQPMDLLAVAAEMDRTSTAYRIGRRPMIAVMAKSGLRVREMCQLRWRDVHVHHQRLVIGEAKTGAGVREVETSSSSSPPATGLLRLRQRFVEAPR